MTKHKHNHDIPLLLPDSIQFIRSHYCQCTWTEQNSIKQNTSYGGTYEYEWWATVNIEVKNTMEATHGFWSRQLNIPLLSLSLSSSNININVTLSLPPCIVVRWPNYLIGIIFLPVYLLGAAGLDGHSSIEFHKNNLVLSTLFICFKENIKISRDRLSEQHNIYIRLIARYVNAWKYHGLSVVIPRKHSCIIILLQQEIYLITFTRWWPDCSDIRKHNRYL